MKLLYLLPLMCLPLFSLAQSESETAIQKRLQAYYEANQQKDWEAVVDMLYPPLLELSSREDMVQMFSDMEGNGMVVNMNSFDTQNISPPFEQEGERYAKVDYLSEISIQFTSKAFRDSAIVERLRNNFNQEYGADMVQHDAETNTFTVQADKSMLAIKQGSERPWTFIELDDQNPTIGKLIPEAVIEHFRKE